MGNTVGDNDVVVIAAVARLEQAVGQTHATADLLTAQHVGDLASLARQTFDSAMQLAALLRAAMAPSATLAARAAVPDQLTQLARLLKAGKDLLCTKAPLDVSGGYVDPASEPAGRRRNQRKCDRSGDGAAGLLEDEP